VGDPPRRAKAAERANGWTVHRDRPRALGHRRDRLPAGALTLTISLTGSCAADADTSRANRFRTASYANDPHRADAGRPHRGSELRRSPSAASKRPAEQVRACADAILAQSEDLPAGAFALTFTERRIRGFLRELSARPWPRDRASHARSGAPATLPLAR
jgi:hypothetical protein